MKSGEDDDKCKNKCEECKENPSKYKCPGCSLCSCSLACVKAHKLRTGCSGSNRTGTPFVPLSQFNDRILLSDYNLLEETKRVTESARRLRGRLRAFPYPKLPNYLRILKGAASARRTKLLLLPPGMSKREINQSRYDQRKKFISWTIEWRFHSTTDVVVLLDHRIHEDTILYSVMEKHLNPGPWNHPVRQFSLEQPDSLKYFIRKYPKGSRSPFYKLDIRTPLRQQLANIVILEYPVVHVFLPSHRCEFEIVNEARLITCTMEAKNCVRNDHPSPRGVAFVEEEIKDGESSDPQVYDFLNNANLGPRHQLNSHEMSERALNESSSGELFARVPAGNGSHPSSWDMELGSLEDMVFDIDQDLLDAYSNLIAEMNPNDLCDFEGEFSKVVGVEEQKDSTFGANFPMEELEEGEIAE
ncbi:hypothetical protein K2173_027175 [Erythroxylum novogranatense]|uniref:HIT-type domain-containing protein n=1 Tax=Erythroxylum novogranatense TaxID=1862640 RepID=A0AAV8U0X0_9ROSI|nr:hypothetical protein K2173_027175 [Erythroxylum novogranatense]